MAAPGRQDRRAIAGHCTISQEPLQLGYPNLIYKYCTMSLGNPIILRSQDFKIKVVRLFFAGRGPAYSGPQR